jgi:membrane fusion protein (multidrug efflux system)
MLKVKIQSRRWLVAITFCTVLFIGLAAFKAMQISAAIAFGKSFPEPSETVEWVKAETKAWPQTISAPGELVAAQSLELRNELGGNITAIHFASGDAVAKSQVLVQLDISEEQAQLQAAEAQAALSRLSLQRYEKLMSSNASSKDQYDQAQAEQAVAMANVQALKARIRKKTITAPFAAIAGLHELEVGQYLAANSAITHLVGSGNTLWVDFYLPQQQAGLPVGTAVLVSAQGILPKPLTGKIIAKDAALSASSRNLRFRAAIANTNNQLHPGVAVNVAIANAPALPGIVLPAMAVRYEPGSRFVYIVEPASDGDKTGLRAHKRKVSAGPEIDGQVLIIDGLNGGETVAVNGSYKLKDNMLVFLKPDADPAASIGSGVSGEKVSGDQP